MKYLIAIALSACLLLSLNSCTKCDGMGQRAIERGIAKGIEQRTGGQVDIGLGHAVRIPAGFPSELVPPSGRAIAKWSAHDANGSGDYLTFETRVSLDRVITYYENLTGWNVQNNMEGTSGTVMSLENGSQNAVVTVAQSEGKTTVAIIYTKK